MGDADRDCGHRSDGRRQAPGSHGLGQDKREDAAHHRASRRLLGNHRWRVSVSPQDIETGVLASRLVRGSTLDSTFLRACVRLHPAPCYVMPLWAAVVSILSPEPPILVLELKMKLVLIR